MAFKGYLITDAATGGATLGGTLNIGSNSLKLSTGLDDLDWSGFSEAGVAGTALAFGDLCYLNDADSRWELADNDESDAYDKKLGICILTAEDGAATEMLVWGNVRCDALFPTMTVGVQMYMSGTAGDITGTAPASPRAIGYANNANELFFCPTPYLNAAYSPLAGSSSLVTVGTLTGGNVVGAIADKGLSIAKLADGTDGQLITWDANGVIAAVATGDVGEVLTSNGAGAAPTFQAAAGGGATDVQIFDADGTWTKPVGAKMVEVICIGSGGGGGSGRRGGDGAEKTGGGGGGGATVNRIILRASEVGDTEAVTVGTGGTGGAAVTSDTTDGNNGGNGESSSFGTWISVGGGGGGLGGPSGGVDGSIGGGSGGLLASANLDAAGSPGAAAATNGVGLQGVPGSIRLNGLCAEWGGGGGGGCLYQVTKVGGSSIFAAGGGGPGGSVSHDAPYTGYDGGAGGNSGSYTPGGGGAGGTGGATGGHGTAGASNAVNKKWYGGQGGGGGGGKTGGTTGGNGGTGGVPGGGGGGGSASLNGNTSGAGGNGGRGEVKVITYL